jgi:hypothetical protein
MSDGLYYARNGKSFGPFVLAQLQQLALTGHLRPTDLFWKDGMKEWKPADAIKGLFQASKASQRSVDSRPPFSARTFLIGTAFGLVLGLVLGVRAPWMNTRDQDSQDAKEERAELVTDQEQGDNSVKASERPEVTRLTSGSKRPRQ